MNQIGLISSYLLFLLIAVILGSFPFEALTIFGQPLVRTLGILVVVGFIFKFLFSHLNFKLNFFHLSAVILFSLVIFFQTINGDKIYDSGIALAIGLVSNLLFFLIFCHQIDEPKLLKILLVFLAFSFFMSTIISLYIGSDELSLENQFNQDLGFHDMRESGFLRNANRYAYLGLFIFWSGIFMLNFHLARKFLCYSIIFFATICVLLSLSRSVLLGLCIGLIYLFFISENKKLLILFSLFFILISFQIFNTFDEYGIFGQAIQDRFLLDSYSFTGGIYARESRYGDVFDTINNNSLTGITLGSLEGITNPNGSTYHDPHNVFLFLWQYFGIFGIFLILSYFLWITKTLTTNEYDLKTKIFIAVFSLSMLIPNIFHSTLTWKATLLMFCLIVCLKKFGREKKLSYDF